MHHLHHHPPETSRRRRLPGAIVGTAAALALIVPPPQSTAREQPKTEQHQALVELGRHLFFDIRLSGPGYMACATCHQPRKAFTDGRRVAIGVTGERHPRNTPTLTNVGDLDLLGWANPSPERLEDQMLRPLFSENPIEMGTRGHETPVLLHIASNTVYRNLFARAFGDLPPPINFTNITRAIAAFQRTLVSRNSAYDRFIAGNPGALSPSARRGLAVFESDRAKCAQCHTPPTFTDQRFHNTGLYNADGAGGLPGRDQGLANRTGKEGDIGRFRTPTLRNIAVTAPYMHDGSMTSLDDVLTHYAAGGRAARRGTASPRRSPLITGFNLTTREKADLIDFLESLTDHQFLSNPRFQTPFR